MENLSPYLFDCKPRLIKVFLVISYGLTIGAGLDYFFHLIQDFFKENVRYPVSTCRDQMITFSDSSDPIFNSRDPMRVPETPFKKTCLIERSR